MATLAPSSSVLPLDHRRIFGETPAILAIHGCKNGEPAALELAGRLTGSDAAYLTRPDVIRQPEPKHVVAAMAGGFRFVPYPNDVVRLLDIGLKVLTDDAEAVLTGIRSLEGPGFQNLFPEDVLDALEDALRARRAAPTGNKGFYSVHGVDVKRIANSETAPPMKNYLLYLERWAAACGAVAPRLVEALGPDGALFQHQVLHSAVSERLGVPFPSTEFIQHSAVLEHLERASHMVHGVHPDEKQATQLLYHFLIRRCVPENGDGRDANEIYQTHMDMLGAVCSLLKDPPLDHNRLWKLIRTFCQQTPWSHERTDNFFKRTLEPALRRIANDAQAMDWDDESILRVLHLLVGAEPSGSQVGGAVDVLDHILRTEGDYSKVFRQIAGELSEQIDFTGWPRYRNAA